MSTSKNKFPLEVFPQEMQNTILELKDKLNYPIEFTSVSMLSAISLALGSKVKIERKFGFYQRANTYFCIVGGAGTCKTHPIDFALKPFRKIDKALFEKYEQEMKEYENSKKDKKTPLPKVSQCILNDNSIEALISVMANTPNGSLLHKDELVSWVNDLNRYSQGSEEQFWLSSWNGTDVKLNRINRGLQVVSEPFVNVIGGVQPSVLKEIAKGRTKNGFLDRILFAVLEDKTIHNLSDDDLNPKIFADWENLIQTLYNLRENNPCQTLKFSDDAKLLYVAWEKEITKRRNETNDDTIKEYLGKFPLNCQRLILTLECLYCEYN